MKPDICSSLRCNEAGKYCSKCSHAYFVGQGKDKNGKIWRWQFNSYFGPLFVKANGEALKTQPILETHPAWAPFGKWHKKFIKRTNGNKK
jgi:hypothetical protein